MGTQVLVYKNDFIIRYAVQMMDQEKKDIHNIHRWVNNYMHAEGYTLCTIYKDVLGRHKSKFLPCTVTVCNI